MDHAVFDKRGYPVVEVREGYGEWAQTYEDVVQDEMDLRLFDRLKSVDWAAPKAILDLACGTGRIGVWLKSRGARAIDGIDLTPQMVDAARAKGVYRTLRIADVTNTDVADNSYELCTQSLADEHLPALRPLYQEVARITRSGGLFVIVGFHPYFLMMGMPTHFNNAAGEPITVHSYVHQLSDHVEHALEAGWSLAEMDEGLVDADWLLKKPKWAKYKGLPVSFAMVWQRN